MPGYNRNSKLSRDNNAKSQSFQGNRNHLGTSSQTRIKMYIAQQQTYRKRTHC